MKHEAIKPKIPEIHFMPEGYVDPDRVEFLDQLLEKLKVARLDTTNLVFSGTDGEKLFLPDGSIDRPEAIFGMNEAGWRDAIRKSQSTPGGYIKKDTDVPCIALYDGTRLAMPESYILHQNLENYYEPVEIGDIDPGKDLTALTQKDLLEEVAIHIDYPNACPTDALVGLVFVEEETYKPTSDHGL